MAEADDTLRKNFVKLFPELREFCKKRKEAPAVLMMYLFNYPHSQISENCAISERMSRLVIQEASAIVNGCAGREFKVELLLRIMGATVLGSALIGVRWCRVSCSKKQRAVEASENSD